MAVAATSPSRHQRHPAHPEEDGADVRPAVRLEWEPVRYQEDAGTGWAFLADNVTALRERLVERYGEAAL